jgi:septal ring factor EnvC (AmiA/AmiB activator)
LGILTKISVVVLVVLILLACPVFITQATVGPAYRQAYDRQEREKDLLAQSVRASELVLKQAILERDRFAAALTQDRLAMQTEIDQLRADLSEARQRSTKLDNDLSLINGELAKLRADYQSNTERTKTLTQQRDEAFTKVQMLNDETRRLTDLLKQTQLDMERQGAIIKTLREQLVERDDRLRQLEQEYGVSTAARTTTAPVAGARSDVPINGTVTSVRGELASINVGSAKGVKPGMQLIIYRGSEYVAKLRVDQVDVGQSAGIISEKRLDPLQGDKVTDRLE